MLLVFLIVLALAVAGALLNPISLLLRALPWDLSGVIRLLDVAKTFIADFLTWGFLGLLMAMGIAILWARYGKRKELSQPDAAEAPRWERDGYRPVPMAVGIIAYNEGEAIARVVRDFKAQQGVVEVVVVDNNSRDQTAEMAAAAGARVVRETNQGYGHACIRALREGLAVPGAEVVVLTEGDGTFTAGDLPKFQAYIRQADVVIGTRVVPGLVEKGSQMDYFFTWGNIVGGTLLRLRFWNTQFLGVARLSDLGCTYRAVRREALERVMPDLVVGGHHFSPHMMVVALARGLSMIEIPVTFRRRIGLSKGASQSLTMGLKVGLVMLWHILTHSPPKRTNHAGQSRDERQGVVGTPR